jgi:hemolysin III
MHAPASRSLHHAASGVGEATERLAGHTREVLHEVKPKLRGWLHAAGAPLTLVAGVILVAQSPSPTPRIGMAVFVASAVVLFSVSALYHRGSWSPRTAARLRRLDHANIFVHIAGTYTAFALLLLEPDRAARLLTLVWLAAALGVVFRVCWIDAPRWLHTPAYVVVGAAALLFTADFAVHQGSTPLTLMLTGGAIYLVGALIYSVQRPNPLPRWFGFHEIFHALTVIAIATHFAALSVATTAAV